VIGNIVYVAEFDDTTITGFKLKGGKKTFEYHTGAYMPAISDGRRLYIVGYSSIHALQPITKKQMKQAQEKRQARKEK
jgi:hypothetical protein